MARDTRYALCLRSNDTPLGIEIPMEESVALLQTSNSILTIEKIFTNTQMRIYSTSTRRTTWHTDSCWLESNSTWRHILGNTFFVLLTPVLASTAGQLKWSWAIAHEIFFAVKATGEIGWLQSVLTRTLVFLYEKIQRWSINWNCITKNGHSKICRRLSDRIIIIRLDYDLNALLWIILENMTDRTHL